MFKKWLKFNKIFIIAIAVILVLSSSAFAVYKALSLGDKKLGFQLILSSETTNPTIVNEPKLVDGMIPIKWDNNKSKWVITTNTDEN